MDIKLVALEDRMGFHADDDIEVAWRPAHIACFPFTGQPDARAVVHTRGDLDIDLARHTHPFAAVALGARRRDDLTCAVTGGAGRGGDDRAKERALLAAAHFTRPIAGRTS